MKPVRVSEVEPGDRFVTHYDHMGTYVVDVTKATRDHVSVLFEGDVVITLSENGRRRMASWGEPDRPVRNNVVVLPINATVYLVTNV